MWGLVILLCVPSLINANQLAGWDIPKGEEVVSLTGKMNVPQRGSNLHRPGRGQVVFWPGIKGNDGFFMQTILIDRDIRPELVWLDAAYGGKCAGKGKCTCMTGKAKQCNDDAVKFAKAGATISWYIEKRDNLWVAGFTSSDGQSSEVWMNMGDKKADKHVTALLVEGKYDSADETPKEPLEVWDIVAKNPQGKPLEMTFLCNQDGREFSHIDCNWKDGNRKGVRLTFGRSFNRTVVV